MVIVINVVKQVSHMTDLILPFLVKKTNALLWAHQKTEITFIKYKCVNQDVTNGAKHQNFESSM